MIRSIKKVVVLILLPLPAVYLQAMETAVIGLAQIAQTGSVASLVKALPQAGIAFKAGQFDYLYEMQYMQKLVDDQVLQVLQGPTALQSNAGNAVYIDTAYAATIHQPVGAAQLQQIEELKHIAMPSIPLFRAHSVGVRPVCMNEHWGTGRNALITQYCEKAPLATSVRTFDGIAASSDGTLRTLPESMGDNWHVRVHAGSDLARVEMERAAVLAHCQQIAQQKALAHYERLLHKPLIAPIEQRLIYAARNGVKVSDTFALINELNQYAQRTEQLYAIVHNDFQQGLCFPEIVQGAAGVLQEAYNTVELFKGALCDSNGNIVGIQSTSQRQFVAKLYGGHCRAVGYPDNVLQRRYEHLQADMVAHARTKPFFDGARLKDTPFNKDLFRCGQYIRLGDIDQARALLAAYNPSRYSWLSNLFHGRQRQQLYATMQNHVQQLERKLYTHDGILKSYTYHPRWQEMQQHMQAHPDTKRSIFTKLQNEHAFCVQLCDRIGLTNPTAEQWRSLYDLCQHTHLSRFDVHIASINRVSDINAVLQTCQREHALLEHIRSRLGCSEQIWKRIHAHHELLQYAHLDPQFETILQPSLYNASKLEGAVATLQQRLDASHALLQRCGVARPNELTRVMSYHLIEMNDASDMIAYLSRSLDPHHANALVRQSYHDFFDKQGIQKLLPIKNEVRQLFKGSIGRSIVLKTPQEREAFNMLINYDVQTPEQLEVVRRGIAYFQAGCGKRPDALVQKYALRYVDALAHPRQDNRHILNLSNAVDAYIDMKPTALKSAVGAQLEQKIGQRAALASGGIGQLPEVEKKVGCGTGQLPEVEKKVGCGTGHGQKIPL